MGKVTKKQKGQVMVLDILFALVIIILMFFLLFRWSEVEIYNSSSDKVNYELNNVGLLVFNKLTNNSEINCYASDSENNYIISNCFAIDSDITKDKLGVPSTYSCNFDVIGLTITINECDDALPTGDSYFALNFDVVTNATKQVSKGNYINDFLNGTGNLTTTTAKLVVWKT